MEALRGGSNWNVLPLDRDDWRILAVRRDSLSGWIKPRKKKKVSYIIIIILLEKGSISCLFNIL